jgi:hypothetical protein
MHARVLDLTAAATLFAGADGDIQSGRLPMINRAHRYFRMAGHAVRLLCETDDKLTRGSFIVQRGHRYDKHDLALAYARLRGNDFAWRHDADR